VSRIVCAGGGQGALYSCRGLARESRCCMKSIPQHCAKHGTTRTDAQAVSNRASAEGAECPLPPIYVDITYALPPIYVDIMQTPRRDGLKNSR